MNIFLLRMSALGDVTHALTVVREIQSQSPDARITWLVGRLEHRLLKGLEGVEFIEFNKSGGWAAVRELRNKLKRRRFDVLLHMQVAMRANLISTLIPAERKIGYDRERSRDLHGLVIDERIARGERQHVVEAMQSFLVPLGMRPAKQVRWDIPLATEDHCLADQFLDDSRRTLCLSPVSSHKLRNWSIEGYAAVADHAAEQHGMQVLLTGGPSDFERGFNAAIESLMTTKPENLTGKDTLKQLSALLGRCDLVLSPDTGPMHIANAMGTDVIGLHAATNPWRSGAYGQAERSVNQYPEMLARFLNTDIEHARWGTRLERPGVMDLISIEQVREKLDEWVREQSVS